MPAQTVNPNRAILKEKCYEVLSTFENQEMTSRQVYDMINDPLVNRRTIAAILFQMSNVKNGKYADIYNVRKGIYTYSKQPLKQRLTPSRSGKKVTISKNDEGFTITAATPTPATNNWVESMPVFDTNSLSMLPTDEHLILKREDGTVWYAKKVK